MTNVWILTNAASEDPDDWKTKIAAVVLPNKKVISKYEDYIDLLTQQIKEAQEFWEEDGNTGLADIEIIYEYLDALHTSPYHLGGVVSIEEAKEYVKLSGGI